MNRMMMAALTAAMLCGSTAAALAAPPAGTADAQLQAQVQALQAEVAALQSVSDIQQGCGPGAVIPSGG